MSKNKSRIIKLLSFFIIIFALIYFNQAPSKETVSKPTGASASRLVPAIKAVRVKKQNLQSFHELPARITAYRTAEIRPQVDGIIKKRVFEEGSFVTAGTQLYQIDPTIYQANYEGAEANLKTLEAKKIRYEALSDVEAVGKQELDDVSAAFDQADAETRAAEASLNYTKVYAPISGYIGKSNVTEGALATTNQSQILTTITQLDPIYVDIAIPAKDADKFRNQNELPVSLIINGKEYEGRGVLKFVEVFADETTDSIRMRALFSNEQNHLISGMFATAKIELAKYDIIAIPQRATNRNSDGDLMVWVVDMDNKIAPRIIKAEESYQDQWIVLEGLEDNDVILYEGFQKLAKGMKIKPIFLNSEETQ